MNIFAHIAKLAFNKHPFVLVNIIECQNHEDNQGSDPKLNRMIIKKNGEYIGKIYNDKITQLLIHKGMELINASSSTTFNIRFNHTKNPQKQGMLTVFMETICPNHTLAEDEFNENLVLIRGAGDIATGVAVRLHHAGFQVIMTDLPKPTVIRRSVSFAQSIYTKMTQVEDVTAIHAKNDKDAKTIIANGHIPVLIDKSCQYLSSLKPKFVVDAILAKHNLGTHKTMAPITIALGPGFIAGEDCHAVIETNRGHYLGKIIYQGKTADNTGIPGNIGGYTYERVLRSPCNGLFNSDRQIGELVNEGDIIAYIDKTPIYAPLSGMIRGLLQNNLTVSKGFKVGDIDPRGSKADYTTISDKARAIGGSVLEAMMYLNRQA